MLKFEHRFHFVFRFVCAGFGRPGGFQVGSKSSGKPLLLLRFKKPPPGPPKPPPGRRLENILARNVCSP